MGEITHPEALEERGCGNAYDRQMDFSLTP